MRISDWSSDVCSSDLLEMTAITESGSSVSLHAYNEVSLLRQTRQTAHVCIALNDRERLDELICDGLMMAPPAGSTAYHFSAPGPFLPLGRTFVSTSEERRVRHECVRTR